MKILIWRITILAALSASLIMFATSAEATPRRVRPAGGMGALLAVEPIAAPPGASAAYRIHYRSSNSKGRPVVVSGLIAIPTGQAPKGGRPVVSWGHGTTGVADECAPSRTPASAFRSVTGLNAMLNRGEVVVATDYLGLGMPGVHPYLDGDSAARSMIDAVRAVRRLPGAQAGNRFVAWGFSQGGHATLFVADRAAAYAPELHLVGAAAASPPTQLLPIFKADVPSRAGKVVVSYAIASWSKYYGAPVQAVAKPEAISEVRQIASTCSLTDGDDLHLGLDTFSYDRTGFLKDGAEKQRVWGRLIERNNTPLPNPKVPLFVAQGTWDQMVEQPVTRNYIKRACAKRVRVRYVEEAGADHGGAARRASRSVTSWINDRFGGVAAPDDCTAAVSPGRLFPELGLLRVSRSPGTQLPSTNSRAIARR